MIIVKMCFYSNIDDDQHIQFETDGPDHQCARCYQNISYTVCCCFRSMAANSWR